MADTSDNQSNGVVEDEEQTGEFAEAGEAEAAQEEEYEADFDAEAELGDETAVEDVGEVDAGGENDDINVKSLEELIVDEETINEAQSAWSTFVNQAASKEAAADAVYGVLYNASPALQPLFVMPRAIAASKFFTAIATFAGELNNPPSLKAKVENLAFGHLGLDVTPPRVALFRDAILDLLQAELGHKFSPKAYGAFRALLNYIGGAYIYIKIFYNERIKLLNSSWALSNDSKSNKEHFATMGSMECAKQENEMLAETEENGESTKKPQQGEQNVPTNFKEMFLFNSAVMGFGGNLWMNEVLACFDNIVTNVANPQRLTEECDVLVCRIAKTSSGKINLSEFKSGMLASLRSLLPKVWTTAHEVAWTWLWELVERAVMENMGQPPKWERAYANFLDNIDEETGYRLRKDLFQRFFTTAPGGQDYFKQSNTYLHLVSTKVLTMVLDMYRDPVRMVDDISSVGLRHVGYGAPPEYFGSYCSAIVEVIKDFTSDETCVEGFKWSLGLIARSIVRTIAEGSTLVMKAINVNTKKSMTKALSNASRGERAGWMLMIQVGSQNISPLAWAIQSGSLHAASTMLGDLLTFRADRDRYYYSADELFNRHPDIVLMLIGEAPSLIPQLFHGLIWRSRLTQNGFRRVNYFIKHLLIDPEGKFAHTMFWILRMKDAKTVCHPTLVFLCDVLWSRVALRSFLFRKSWFLSTLLIFVLSQSIAPHFADSDAKRYVIFGLRGFVYGFSLGRLEYTHARRIVNAYRSGETTSMFNKIRIPSYLGSWQEVSNFLLMLFLMVMATTEPILHCLPFWEGNLFDDTCEELSELKFFNSIISMLTVFIYILLCIDLAVFSNRVSAYVLVVSRMLSELAVFIFALAIVLITFSSALSCLVQPLEQFHGVHRGTLTLWELAMGLFSEVGYSHIHDEPILLVGSFVFMIMICIFLLNLLVAQLTCAWDAIYVDMVGYARLKRIQVIVDTMPSVSPHRWNKFVTEMGFEHRIEFNEGDIGLNNGLATTEAANAHPTTTDIIKRFGGSTSPDMQWPEEENVDGDDSDKFERLETLIKRAMERIEGAVIGTKKGKGGGSSMTGGGDANLHAGQESDEQEAHEEEE
jgi:hemoglobin-like flavoprotein